MRLKILVTSVWPYLSVTPHLGKRARSARLIELLKMWGTIFENFTGTRNPTHKQFVKEHLVKIFKNGFIFDKEKDATVAAVEFCFSK